MAYLSATDVKVTVDLVNDAGEPIDAIALQYQVTDEAKNIVVAKTPLVGFNAGDVTAEITIPAVSNTLPVNDTASSLRGLRFVELFLQADAGTVKLETYYVLEAANPLVEGINSFQSYQSAVFRASMLTGVGAWMLATKDEKITSLIRARQMIAQLRFRYDFDDDTSRRVVVVSSDILDLSQSQFAALEESFRNALQNAQVIQASYLLDEANGSINSLRAEGVISTENGEARQVFAKEKPIERAICKQALKEIGRYIDYSVRIGRG